MEIISIEFRSASAAVGPDRCSAKACGMVYIMGTNAPVRTYTSLHAPARRATNFSVPTARGLSNYGRDSPRHAPWEQGFTSKNPNESLKLSNVCEEIQGGSPSAYKLGELESIHSLRRKTWGNRCVFSFRENFGNGTDSGGEPS
ncbi:hypothetical protein M8J77_018640 [Diaphorina citri]|nr:hypothetical protein M8J77_018640 [Diaphorina citri]